jgi:predicted PurR-regulated permease PerM
MLSVPVVLVVLAVGVLTVVSLVVVIVRLVRRLGRLAHDLDDLQRDLTPALEQLQRDGEITEAELNRVGDRLDQLRATRAARRRLFPRAPTQGEVTHR